VYLFGMAWLPLVIILLVLFRIVRRIRRYQGLDRSGRPRGLGRAGRALGGFGLLYGLFSLLDSRQERRNHRPNDRLDGRDAADDRDGLDEFDALDRLASRGSRPPRRPEEVPPRRFASLSAADQEAAIYRLAFENKGRLTVSDLVLATGLPAKEAEALLDKLVDNTRIGLEVTDAGIVEYEFKEIARRFRKPGDEAGGSQSGIPSV